MRKIRLLFCALLFVSLLFSAEAKVAFAQASHKKISVVTTFYPMHIMALNVVRDVPGVSLENLTPPLTGCLHDYSLTTNDIKKLAGADILIANGVGMESFLQKVLAQYPKLKIAEVAEDISLIANGREANPHVWVSISGAIAEVKNLARAMKDFDPQHAEIYQENADDYIAKLKTLLRKMTDVLAPYKGRKIITFHEAFPYFAKEFGLEIAAVVEREPGSRPSARELAQNIDLIKQSDIKVLFTEPQYPSSAAGTISRETGAKIFVLDPAVTGPDSADAYLDIMEKNLETLKEALK